MGPVVISMERAELSKARVQDPSTATISGSLNALAAEWELLLPGPDPVDAGAQHLRWKGGVLGASAARDEHGVYCARPSSSAATFAVPWWRPTRVIHAAGAEGPYGFGEAGRNAGARRHGDISGHPDSQADEDGDDASVAAAVTAADFTGAITTTITTAVADVGSNGFRGFRRRPGPTFNSASALQWWPRLPGDTGHLV